MGQRQRTKRAWEDLSLLLRALVMNQADFRTYETELGHFVRRWQNRGVPLQEWRRMRRLALMHLIAEAGQQGQPDRVREGLWRLFSGQQPSLADRTTQLQTWAIHPPRTASARQLLRRRVKAVAREVAASEFGAARRRSLAQWSR